MVSNHRNDWVFQVYHYPLDIVFLYLNVGLSGIGFVRSTLANFMMLDLASIPESFSTLFSTSVMITLTCVLNGNEIS